MAVETVALARLSPSLTLYGQVDSPRIANLSAGVTADVVSVPTREGELVSAGQILVTLDHREAQLLAEQHSADVAEITALIESEKQSYESYQESLAYERRLLALNEKAVQRASDLASTRVGSRAQVDEAQQAVERQRLSLEARTLAIDQHHPRVAQLEARLARARAVLERTRLDVERTRVAAPFSGRVSAVHVSQGDRVRNGDRLVRLYDMASLEFRAQIPIRYLPIIRRSIDDGVVLEAVATVDGRPVRAELDRLTGEVGEGRGGVDALFRITEGIDWLALGRTVEMHLALPAVERAVAVPFESVYGSDLLFKLEDGRMKSVRVERVGDYRTPEGGLRLLVKSHLLAPGDRIVITQLPNAIDGLKVSVSE